ncbi:hypothetical protein GCM10009565_06630 [Amycolatopsis albidoflavus]
MLGLTRPVRIGPVPRLRRRDSEDWTGLAPRPGSAYPNRTGPGLGTPARTPVPESALVPAARHRSGNGLQPNASSGTDSRPHRCPATTLASTGSQPAAVSSKDAGAASGLTTGSSNNADLATKQV